MHRIADLFKRNNTGWIVGLILSNFLFGFAHTYQGLSGIITTGFTGFIFAWLFFRTNKNLWAAILANRIHDYHRLPDDLLWRLSGHLKNYRLNYLKRIIFFV